MSTSNVSKLLLSFGAVLLGAHLLSVGCSSSSSNKPNRPEVTETVPADTTLDVVINTILTVIFDDNMDPATIDDTTFTVVDGAAAPVAGTVTYHAPTRSATFVPAADLATNTDFTATITTGAKNTNGVALSPAVSWTFTTGTNTDAVPPTVTATNPANTAPDVAVNSAITADFDEQMNIASINATTFTVNGGAIVAGTVSYDSTLNRATFTPSAALQDSTVYTCTITTGAQDQAQNSLAAPFQWTFTTADATAPTVISSVPSNGATGVALDAVFTATFSEDMLPGSINTISVNINAPAALPASVVYDAGTRTVTLTPDDNLSANTTYRFYVETQVQDLATPPNSMAARFTVQFTTINDAVAPTVVNLHPANTANNAATNTLITATFSEPIDPTTVNGTTFSVADGGGAVAGAVSYDVFSKTATFTPATPPLAADTHTVTLTTGITDLAGNALVVPTWSFTTVAPDNTVPTVLAWTPADSTADVSVATHQVIQFSEPMDRASVQAAFSIMDSAPAAPLNPSQFFWNDAGDTVTVVFDTTNPVGIEADDLLQDDTEQYDVALSGTAQDLAGNALAPDAISWTTQDDVTPPTVLSTVPDFATAQAAAATTTIVINFDEDMDTTFADVELESESDVDHRFASIVASVPADDPDGDLSISWTTPTQLTLDFLGQPLLSNTAYSIEINAADEDGNFLDEEELFIVLTGADSGNPSVISNVPADGATAVNPNSLVLVSFSRTMAPDIFDHVSVSGNGATQFSFERMIDPPGVLLIPLQGWPGSSTVTVSVDALATDASGNTLIGAHSFSFTTSAQTTNSWTLDSDYNERKDGDDNVQTSRFDEEFLFQDSVGNRVFPNVQTLAAQDVTLRETVTGIPLKGFRLDAEEDGQLVLEEMDNVDVDLQTNTDYQLVFNSSLRNTHGVGITPTTLDFTTSDGLVTRPNVDSFPLTEMFVVWNPMPPPAAVRIVEIEARASDDDADTLAIDAQSLQAPAFSVTLDETPPLSGSGFYTYDSSGDETSLANGLNTLLFGVDDSNGNAFSFRRDIWNFGPSGVPTVTGPIGGTSVAGGVPTYTFSFPSATRANADIFFIMVSEIDLGSPFLDETPVLFTVLPTSATSFTHPFDTPLPEGEYVIDIGAASFASGTPRGEFNGFVIGATGNAPDFSVPPPVSGPAVSGSTAQVSRRARSMSIWK